MEAAAAAVRAQLRELEGAYDPAAAADMLNAAARAVAEEELAAARCRTPSRSMQSTLYNRYQSDPQSVIRLGRWGLK